MMDLSNPRGGGGAMGDKMAKIKQQLMALKAKSGQQQQVGGDGSIANDGPIPADKQAQIVRDEDLVRQVLALFGIDYNALISMDGNGKDKSVYAHAVQANPQLLQDVLGSDNPVLAALKVAVGFKPVADFTAKYGSTPEAIKAAMQAEFAAQQKQAKKDKPTKAADVSPVFSRFGGGFRPPAQDGVSVGGDLAKVFGK